jgi:methionyl-tRNA formyltransferase
MRIAFFGTPEFAAPSLRALLGEGFEVVVVVTQPDRPHGRSQSDLVPPPIKVIATDEGLPLLQPERPDTPEFLEALRTYQPDLGVVAAYGHILTPQVLALPAYGMVNVHASLLPKLRGAAPIQHAILLGLEETGVSIMQMDEGLDTGPVLLRVPTTVLPDETAGELTIRLAELGALALVEALTLITSGGAVPEPQDHAQATRAPKVTRELARIRWTEPAEAVARLVRAMDPRPGAWSRVHGQEIKLFGPQPADPPPPDALPGQVVSTETALVVATGRGALEFLDLQPAGRTRMAARAWLRGRGAAKGDAFE